MPKVLSSGKEMEYLVQVFYEQETNITRDSGLLYIMLIDLSGTGFIIHQPK